MASNPIVVNKVRYVGKDFDTYMSELTNFIQNRFTVEEFNNFKESELGVMLMELFSYALMILSFYLDRQASETYLTTALLPANIIRLARQLGFKVRGAIPAHGEIEVTLDQPQSSRLILPIGTQFSGAIIVESVNSVFWDVGETGTKVINVVEGETFEETFISDGTANQVFNLSRVISGTFLGDRSTKVFVDGVLWQEVDFLPFEQQNVYEVSYTSDPPFIMFGDGVSGNIPPVESIIKVEYRVHHGKIGNVKENSIVEIRFPVILGTEVIDLKVSQPKPLVNADDGPDANFIVRSAPFVFKTVGRSVTEEDYDAIANAFSDPVAGAVGKAKAVIVRGISDDVFLQDLISDFDLLLPPVFKQQLLDYLNQVIEGGCKANIVQIHVVEKDIDGRYIQANKELVKRLRDELEKKKESTVKLVFLDGSKHLFRVDVDIKIKILPNFDVETVKLNVKKAIEQALLNKGFGEAIRLSDLYDIVETISGVSFSHINLVEPASKKTPQGDLEFLPFEISTLGTVFVAEM